MRGPVRGVAGVALGVVQHAPAHVLEPRRLRFRADGEPDDVVAVGGLDRSCPLADRQRFQPVDEGAAEQFGQILGGPAAVLAAQHEGIAQPPPERVLGRCVTSLGAKLFEDVGSRPGRFFVAAAAVGADVDVAEREASRFTVAFRVLLEVLPEVGLGHRVRDRRVLDQEGHLLSQPPPDDRVVLVETHARRFAYQDLFPDVVVDQ